MTRKERFPHQIQASAKGANLGCMGFWMEMRTGKSLSSMDTIARLNAYPLLIMCPFIALPGWVNEFRGDGWDMDKVQLVRPEGPKTVLTAIEKLANPEAQVFIVNLNIVKDLDVMGIRKGYRTEIDKATGSLNPRFPRGLGLADWKGIILDESYRIANPDNEITKYLLRYPNVNRHQNRFCLSGTPASEHPYDVCTQYIWMEGEYFGCHSVDEYFRRYWDYVENTYSWVIRDPHHRQEIRDYMQSRGFCATMDSLGLGGKALYHHRDIQCTPEQQKILDWLKIAMTYNHKETGETMIMEPVVRHTFERQAAAGIDPMSEQIISTNKIQDAVEYYLANPTPTVIVNRWRPLVEPVSQAFEAKGIGCPFIHGDVKQSDREQIRLDFQAGKYNVVSCQVDTIKEALDFSRLDTLWFMSNSGSHYARAQTEKRGNHTKRTKPYLVVDQHTEGTTERVLTNVLTQKKKDSTFFIKDFNRMILEQ